MTDCSRSAPGPATDRTAHRRGRSGLGAAGLGILLAISGGAAPGPGGWGPSALPPPARADEGAPLSLLPGAAESGPNTPGSAPAARPAAGDRPAWTTPATPAPLATPAVGAVVEERAGGIEIRDLVAINPDAYGLWTLADGGLEVEVWNGLSAARALDLLSHLTADPPVSRALSDLLVRLILTTATPPQADAGPGRKTEGVRERERERERERDAAVAPPPPGALMAARADLLFALGRHGELEALLRQVPREARVGSLRLRWLEALALLGRYDEACPAVLAAHPDDPPAVLRLAVLCHMRAGNTEAGALAATMLRETRDADETFLALADRLGGLAKAAKIPPPKAPLDAAIIALAREAGVALPSQRPDPAPIWLARAVALSAPAAPALRLIGAERAEAAGALPSDALAFLYGDTPVKDDGRRRLLLSDRSPLTRALAYHRIRDAADPQTRATLAAETLAALRQQETTLGLAFARAIAPLLAGIPPQAIPAPAQPEIARALFLAGRLEGATVVLRHLQTDAGSESAGAPARERALLWAMAQATHTHGAVGALALLADGPEGRTPGAAPPAPNAAGDAPPLLEPLAEAAANGHTGETILLAALVIARAGGPAVAPLDHLVAVAAALDQIGCDEAASALALEALAARAGLGREK